uniref:Uncharacterized protein n=1 Tax=Oryza punctata TaxID=4537 RepID=A0A0E0MEH7_ORYPU
MAEIIVQPPWIIPAWKGYRILTRPIPAFSLRPRPGKNHLLPRCGKNPRLRRRHCGGGMTLWRRHCTALSFLAAAVPSGGHLVVRGGGMAGSLGWAELAHLEARASDNIEPEVVPFSYALIFMQLFFLLSSRLFESFSIATKL